MNEIIPLRQGGELGTDKYWIATEEEAFFRKATKVTIACAYSNAFWILYYSCFVPLNCL